MSEPFEDPREGKDMAVVLKHFTGSRIPGETEVATFLKSRDLANVTPAKALWYLQLQDYEHSQPAMSALMEMMSADHPPTEEDVADAIDDMKGLYANAPDVEEFAEAFCGLSDQQGNAMISGIEDHMETFTTNIVEGFKQATYEDVLETYAMCQVMGFPPFSYETRKLN